MKRPETDGTGIAAEERFQGKREMRMDYTEIGQAVLRRDAPGKISGEAEYLDDLQIDALSAVTVRSNVPCGKLKGIHVPALPPGYSMVSAADIRGVNQCHFYTAKAPFFSENEVRWLGEPVALLVGPDLRVLHDLAARTELQIEPAKSIMTLEEAIEAKVDPYAEFTYGYGDVDGAFASADRIVKTVTVTGAQEHYYLEPLAVLVIPTSDGGFRVYASCQGIWEVKLAVAAVTGCPQEKVRVTLPAVGGGFGGKIEQPLFLAAQAAVAAQKTGQPVKLLYGREEDLNYTVKRHPSKIIMESALDPAGNILGMQTQVWLQGGGYAQGSWVVLDTGIKHAMGVYRFPCVRVNGRVLGTNTQPNGAFRGFGVPQMITAVERHMCDIAKALGEDSFALKKKYLIREGDRCLNGGCYRDVQGLEKAMEEMQSAARRHGKKNRKGFLTGSGTGLYCFGAPYSWQSGTTYGDSKVKLKKDAAGIVHIYSEVTEIGQGITTAQVKIAAKALDIPPERVRFETPDTDSAPYMAMTSASRGTVLFGKAVMNAALKLKPYLDEPGEHVVEEFLRQPDFVKFDMEKTQGDAFHTYTYGAVWAQVEIDPVTASVHVTDLILAQDSGTPIDRRILKGQLEGAAMQGLGMALTERFMPGRKIPVSDYIVPSFETLPDLECIIVDGITYAGGPFGAKSAGEGPTVAIGAAILEAVSRAVGESLYTLPVTPEKLMPLLVKKRKGTF